MKIALLGAAGGIGQPLALLLKTMLPAGTELALYDIAPITAGVAVDVSHIPTAVKVQGYSGIDLPLALQRADVVVITAGVARKPGMDRADLFNVNAGIIQNLIEQVAQNCPQACVAIITNPVNTTVAIAAEVLKKAGVYDKRKLFGVSTLDTLRAEAFVAELKGLDVSQVTVPVIGGHSGTTILPLLSQIPFVKFRPNEIENLTQRIQNAGTEVVVAKAGGGSATLSMAQAAARFTCDLVVALQGETKVHCVYVEGNGEYSRFFAQGVRLGREGVAELLPLGHLSEYESQKLQDLLPILHKDIQLGEDFVKQH